MNKVACIWDAKALLGEGVVWHQEQNCLYWLDIFNSQLHCYKPNVNTVEQKTTLQLSDNISSVIPCSDGGLLASFRDGISHINLENNEVTSICSLEAELPNNRFNDGCADTRGNYWLGSMDEQQTNNTGRFYRYNSQTGVEKLSQLGEICITNGPTFSQDGKWLYFTDTMEGKIFQAELFVNGDIAEPQLHIQFDEQDGYPDGMCCDTQGNLWVCHWGGSRVSCFNPQGQLISEIKLPVPHVTKCCFGGADLSTLFITTAATGLTEEELEQFPLSGGLFAVDVEQQGFVYPLVNK
ncbi:SMP-30/gluconolactonase/LRE family protein [Thalassotalea hakodatensis]|uniref:SMP-30/gluconolactonase/LRE family protein n=1 Tax=Thalassotalea hakodatensis TaxID=3030492 RepID=UPI00257473DD|nr:SMP-30/gluconolactonase/LRE family protein [Thalassotalea hakodatensis]